MFDVWSMVDGRMVDVDDYDRLRYHVIVYAVDDNMNMVWSMSRRSSMVDGDKVARGMLVKLQ